MTELLLYFVIINLLNELIYLSILYYTVDRYLPTQETESYIILLHVVKSQTSWVNLHVNI